METKVKKREWVKTALIIFLAVLLVLTFFSNTIMNASLPEVAAQQTKGGAINAKIRGSGMLSANETYDVTISQTRKIASVKIREGQTVNAGDVLFVLEAEESEQVQQARDQLAQMELNYEKSLISAGNQSAQENHQIEKARDAYNEALAIYNQYSNLEPSRLVQAQAEAEARLKGLQKTYQKAQEDYAQAESAYSELKAEYESLTNQIEALEEEIAAYTEQLNSQMPTNLTAITQQIEDKTRERISAQKVLAADELIYKADSDKLVELAKAASLIFGSTESAQTDAFAKDASYLADFMKSQDESASGEEGASEGGASAETEKDASEYLADARKYALAYNTLQADAQAISDIETELQRLNQEKQGLANDDSAAKEAIERKRMAATQKMNAAISERNALGNPDLVKVGVESLKSAVEAAKDQMDAQQSTVESLSNASGAASTVNSCKEALEELIFQQGLGDGSYLDLQVAKEEIEKQKENIEKLMQNADEQEVKAKVGGVISSVNVTAGNTVGAETPMATINLVDRGYTIKIPVTTEQSKKVKIGDKAELLNYWGGDVDAVLESFANDPSNPGKGKLLVFRLTGDVEPNQNYTLSIGQKSAKYDCLVPNSAIRSDSNGSFVLVLVAKSTPLSTRYIATRAEVQILASDDTSSAVSGLSSGDFVITTSTKPIEAGTQVRLVDNE